MPGKKTAKKAPKTKRTASQIIEQNKNKEGRPTRYLNAYDEQAYKLCLLGATDARMADLFNVSEQTLNTWKKKHPSFLESLKNGKERANAEVADALFNRAKGYSHADTHISNFQGDITITDITKHYPPDTGAAMAWLKNREPELWRDKQDINIGGDMSVRFNLDYTPTDGD